MRNDIKEKLQLELNKEIKEESQVVYILSRVRKMLESDQSRNQGKYKKLKFYCDWALHAEIEKGTKAFQQELEKFIQGDYDIGAQIVTYQYFETEFLDFLREYEISSGVYSQTENRMSFKRLMAKIYSDTPLIVTFTKKFKITTNEGTFTKTNLDTKLEVGYRIEPME